MGLSGCEMLSVGRTAIRGKNNGRNNAIHQIREPCRNGELWVGVAL